MRQFLVDVIRAAVAFNPKVGYATGMSHISAVLVMNMDTTYEAFQSLVNILNWNIHRTFCEGTDRMARYYLVFDLLLSSNVPRVYKHLKRLGISANMYMPDWIVSILAQQVFLLVYKTYYCSVCTRYTFSIVGYVLYEWRTIFIPGHFWLFENY